MRPHYSQEEGYLRPAADVNLVNTYTHRDTHINMEIHAKAKPENSSPICLCLREVGDP